jgi:hypothetical protein
MNNETRTFEPLQDPPDPSLLLGTFFKLAKCDTLAEAKSLIEKAIETVTIEEAFTLQGGYCAYGSDNKMDPAIGFHKQEGGLTWLLWSEWKEVPALKDGNLFEFIEYVTPENLMLADGENRPSGTITFWVEKDEVVVEFKELTSSMDPETDPEKYERDIGKSIYGTVMKVLSDPETIKSFQKIQNSFLRIIMMEAKDQKEVAQTLAEINKELLGIIAITTSMSAYEAVSFYDTYIKGLLERNNREAIQTIDHQLSLIQVLQMKFGELERNLMSKEISKEIGEDSVGETGNRN